MEELRKVQLFAGIDDQRLDELRAYLWGQHYETGEVILHQGEATEALYFLLSGKVVVTLKDDSGVQHILAELGQGETFGERALLTGEMRTADVIAREPARVLSLERDAFEALLVDYPEIHANLCVKLARQLGNWAIRHQEDERENREILTNLIGWQLLPEFESFPGKTPAVRLLNQRLEALGKGDRHVLILGERGTWKDLVARLIHFHQADDHRPVLFLDCATPPPVMRDRKASEQPNWTTS